ncbi:MAG: hypothetical protein ACOYJY_04935 [Acutalibacteraceae bacterium]
MDDLSRKIESFLQSPDNLQKVQAAMASLTASPASPGVPAPLSGLLGDGAGLLSAFGGDSRETALLKALRPYLHGERVGRVDDAIRLLQIARLLPLLGLTGEKGGDRV